MGEIAALGRQKFYQYLYLLTSDPQKLYKLEEPISTFAFIVVQTLLAPEFKTLIEEAFNFFIHEKVYFLYDASEIQIGQDVENHRVFNEANYPRFVQILRTIFRMPKQREYNAESSKAQQIIDKIKRGQQQVKEIKAKKGTDDEVDIDSLVSSLGLYYQNINVVWDLPYYTFFDQVSRLQYKQSYDNNIVFTAAGAKIPKNKMKYWIRKVQDSKGG